MKKGLLKGVLICLALALSYSTLWGMAPSPKVQASSGTDRWKSIKEADKGVVISPEWEAPVALEGGVNTIGWEDSASVSYDGDTMTFSYFRIDPIRLIFKRKVRVDGPMRPGWPTEEPFNSYGADIYISKKVGGRWQEPQNIGAPVNLPETSDGDQWLSEDGMRIYFNSAEGKRNRGIYFAERKGGSGPWRTPEYLEPAINSGHEDENPFLSSDENMLYFESARPGGFGKKDLYVSEKVGGRWQEPKNLGPAINTKADEVQPFISRDGNILLFSRDDSIYRSFRSKDGSWGAPEKIVSGNVGEPTLTDSGDLYFIHVYKSDRNEFDADIMWAKKK